MKILFISTRLPHEKALSGHSVVRQRIRRLIARGYEVGLAAFEHESDAPHLAAWREELRDLELVPLPRRPLAGKLVCRFLERVPSRFACFYSKEMLRRIGDMVERSRYDVVIAEFAVMGQYLCANPYLPAVRKIASVHQCYTIVSRKRLQLHSHSLSILREWFAFRNLRNYEFHVYRDMDRVLVLTPEERFGLLSMAPDLRLSVIPSGVDVEYFQPAADGQKEQAILFTGSYGDEPNRDAVLWFCKSIWPQLKTRYPDLRFYVVGPGARASMLDLQRRDPRIVITGAVDDIRPYLAKAKVFVCPVRMGSGLHGKLFEAMAAGVPVVSSRLGAEGIPIQMGDNGFVADKPQIMAQQIGLLLEDESLRKSIVHNARTMVAGRFSWERGVDLLEGVIHELVGPPRAALARQTVTLPV